MKYSIITVNYNNCDGLLSTIKSVINQTCKDYEFIVIDGGSTDGSKELLEQYDSQINYWVSEPDKGIYNGMNKGILKAQGDYINFMNSGDTFYDCTTLQQVSKLMDGSDIIVGKDYNVDSISGNSAYTILPLRISFVTFFMQTIPHQSSFIRRALFNDSLYNENLKIVADWKFFLDKVCYDGCTILLINMPISQREQGGISNRLIEQTKQERQHVLNQLLPIGIKKDYESLSELDYNTLYNLLNLCEMPKPRRILTWIIKLLYRINSETKHLFR